MNLDMALTLIALAAGVALIASSTYLDKRRRRDFRPNAIPIPIMPMLMIGAVIALLALIHLTTIWRDYR
jgi:lysylphosphatidylglycerol synthetase-like protein (DUF2156 family)